MHKPHLHIKFQAILLLVGELVLLIAIALFADIYDSQRWPQLLYLILFSAGGYAMAKNKQWLVAFLTVGISGLICRTFEESILMLSISTICYTIAFIMVFYAVIGHCFFRTGVESADRIIGGIAGYILLGFFWTSQTTWALLGSELAYINARIDMPATDTECLYYSFVTLTGLGYGDIVPTTPIARLVAVLNTLSGVLYLAIFISGLMGGLASKDQPKEGGE